MFCFVLFLNILFIYLTEREREGTSRERQAERQREAVSLLSREPDVGLDPRTLRSRPGPKAEA